MKVYENVKSEIQDVKSGEGLFQYILGLQRAAIIYCNKNYPEEVTGDILNPEITMVGLIKYFNSDEN